MGDTDDDAKTADEGKSVWSTATINDLPDSSFLYIETGGARDDEGKTSPRSLRHFPYKDASGKIDLAHVRNAIAQAPKANVPDDVKARVQARARRLLESSSGSKAANEGDEWKGGAAVELRALGYALLDLSDTLADELKAMVLLGEETKGYARIRGEMRGRIGQVARNLSHLLEWAEKVDQGEDGRAQVEHRRRKLALLDL